MMPSRGLPVNPVSAAPRAGRAGGQHWAQALVGAQRDATRGHGYNRIFEECYRQRSQSPVENAPGHNAGSPMIAKCGRKTLTFSIGAEFPHHGAAHPRECCSRRMPGAACIEGAKTRTTGKPIKTARESRKNPVRPSCDSVATGTVDLLKIRQKNNFFGLTARMFVSRA
jgi:hypothetical protein